MTFSVTILGSSAAVPTSQRYPTAQALQVDDHFFLVDCAEGTQMQLRRYKIRVQQIRAIFISHLHGDHVFGLPGLLSSLSLLKRTESVDLFGPPYMEDWLRGQLKYFTPLGFPLLFHTLTAEEPEFIYEDKRITVTCFPLKHRVPTWGYLFREKKKLLNIRKDMIDFYHIPLRDIPAIKAGGDYYTEEGKPVPNAQLTHPPVKPRSYAYCSDTVYVDGLSRIVKDVDLLYHEATYGNDGRARSKETVHSTAEDAARVALAANAGKLVIGHFSARYKDVTPLVNEARNIFPMTEAAEDGMVFEIEKRHRPKQ
ncbi:MAG: ribonuclease Z [Prevotellaceae bacterium]|jgi:ribonuclease Z|nr:ribonuclease Z [Prevotellaceae bacterium]